MPVRREQVAAALKYLGDKADLRGRAERALSLDPQEQDLADVAVETGASFIPGVGQALAARDVERARRANDPAGMAMASMGAIPGGRLAKLLKGFDPTRLELDVYHGTPHRFPATEANPLGEFDASKIGTGEGAQAYGHGVYLAESPKVAGGYAEKLAYTSKIPMSGYDVASRSNPELMQKLKAVFGDDEIRINRAIVKPTEFKNLSPELKAEINAFKRQSKGTLYKADLPDEMIDRMLDWDKPLSEQPALVKQLEASGFLKQAPAPFSNRYVGPTGTLIDLDSPGGNLVMGSGWNQKTSAALREAGIPGIRYLDAGSRGKAGTGTRNFVVFPGEEKKITILERK